MVVYFCPLQICGNLKRQHEAGVFADVELKYVVLHRTSAARWHGTQILIIHVYSQYIHIMLATVLKKTEKL